MRSAALVLALSAAAAAHAQQAPPPRTPSAPQTVPPPVVLPLPPLAPQPAGGLTTGFPTPPPAQPVDLYRAPNDRVFDSRLRDFVPGFGVPYLGPYLAPQAPTTVIVVPPPAAPERATEPKATVEPPAAVLPPPVRPTGPTRMYLIPNCYLGNIPPRRERLPAGCDIRRVRVLENK